MEHWQTKGMSENLGVGSIFLRAQDLGGEAGYDRLRIGESGNGQWTVGTHHVTIAKSHQKTRG